MGGPNFAEAKIESWYDKCKLCRRRGGGWGQKICWRLPQLQLGRNGQNSTFCTFIYCMLAHGYSRASRPRTAWIKKVLTFRAARNLVILAGENSTPFSPPKWLCYSSPRAAKLWEARICASGLRLRRDTKADALT